jgi:hypothetical protein
VYYRSNIYFWAPSEPFNLLPNATLKSVRVGLCVDQIAQIQGTINISVPTVWPPTPAMATNVPICVRFDETNGEWTTAGVTLASGYSQGDAALTCLSTAGSAVYSIAFGAPIPLGSLDAGDATEASATIIFIVVITGACLCLIVIGVAAVCVRKSMYQKKLNFIEDENVSISDWDEDPEGFREAFREADEEGIDQRTGKPRSARDRINISMPHDDPDAGAAWNTDATFINFAQFENDEPEIEVDWTSMPGGVSPMHRDGGARPIIPVNRSWQGNMLGARGEDARTPSSEGSELEFHDDENESVDWYPEGETGGGIVSVIGDLLAGGTGQQIRDDRYVEQCDDDDFDQEFESESEQYEPTGYRQPYNQVGYPPPSRAFKHSADDDSSFGGRDQRPGPGRFGPALGQIPHEVEISDLPPSPRLDDDDDEIPRRWSAPKRDSPHHYAAPPSSSASFSNRGDDPFGGQGDSSVTSALISGAFAALDTAGDASAPASSSAGWGLPDEVLRVALEARAGRASPAPRTQESDDDCFPLAPHPAAASGGSGAESSGEENAAFQYEENKSVGDDDFSESELHRDDGREII